MTIDGVTARLNKTQRGPYADNTIAIFKSIKNYLDLCPVMVNQVTMVIVPGLKNVHY